MYINQVFELTMLLDNERFQKVLNRVCKKTEYMEENESEYIDRSWSSKGITVIFRDSQYKKKVKLIVDSALMLNGRLSDTDSLIRKLDKRINEYFNFKYKLDDFVLSDVMFAADIDVHRRENVLAYLKVLRRIGRVKGFSPADYDCFENVNSFCLDGNSNNITFGIYDLKGIIKNQIREDDTDRKKLKSVLRETEGILRTEVRLTKPKAVRTNTSIDEVAGQIAELSAKSQEIFLDVVTHIIPYGDYHKKGKAEEIVRKKVEDNVLRRRMLQLLALIPEKKSLYLAQKAMNCRNIERVMDEFARINVSPVTISKRHDVKNLENLYAYLFEGV